MQRMSNPGTVKKILIADDEPDILEIIQYNLSSEGYQVITARNGNEAIDMARKHQPDLVILDVMMPGKNGIEVCRLLRLQPAFKDTLIIFLSAINDEVTEISGLETGADDYLTKPISPKILVSKVNALFRRLNKPETGIIQIGDLQIDREKYMINFKGEDIVIARKEFELLALLASKPCKVFLRHSIRNHG